MDLSSILTEVRDILGEESADFWSDAELTRYINEGQRRFAGDERWNWLITEGTGTLTADDPELELVEGVDPNRHMNIRLQKDGETRAYLPIKVAPTKGFELGTLYTSTASYPEWFYITRVYSDLEDGNYTTVVKFVPTPSADIDATYQYFRTPADLEASPDIPDLPLPYHKALVHYAAGTAWLKELNGGKKAQEQFDLYAVVRDQARDEQASQAPDDFLVVGKDEPQLPQGRRDIWSRIPETLGP
jgi:hypothetical protein